MLLQSMLLNGVKPLISVSIKTNKIIFPRAGGSCAGYTVYARMEMQKKLLGIMMGVLFFTSCSFIFDRKKTPDISSSDDSFRVSFYNESSHQVELYQNINPQPYDDTTKPVVILQPAETKSVRLLESREKSLVKFFTSVITCSCLAPNILKRELFF